jgi:hypothetical protein
MENGNAFRAFIQQTIQELTGIKVVDYFAEELPCELDGRMQTIIATYQQAAAAEREQFPQALPAQQLSLFGIYGHRAATLAARQQSEAWLLSGLIGYAIANATIPEKRRVEVGLAVYFHVALKLGLKPVDVFEEAAQVAAAEMAQKLLVYGRRSDVTLTKYGWQELKTAEGVKYKFTYG